MARAMSPLVSSRRASRMWSGTFGIVGSTLRAGICMGTTFPLGCRPTTAASRASRPHPMPVGAASSEHVLACLDLGVVSLGPCRGRRVWPARLVPAGRAEELLADARGEPRGLPAARAVEVGDLQEGRAHAASGG